MAVKKIAEILEDKKGHFGVIISDKSGIIFEKNISEVFKSASLIKLFILLALDECEWNKKIQVSEDKKVGGSGVLAKLKSNLTLTVEELAILMIAYSDNTATNILIDYIGIDNINFKIKKHGFCRTVLARKMMDSEAVKNGRENYTTPGEVYEVLQRLYSNKKYFEILKMQEINTKLSLYLSENEDVIFIHKTGELKNTEHDAGRFIYKDEYTDAVVLCENLADNSIGIEIQNKIGKILIEDLINKVEKN